LRRFRPDKQGMKPSPAVRTASRRPDRNPAARIHTILVPTDFSPDSNRAFPMAAELARKSGATVVLLHVVPAVLPAGLSQIGMVFEENKMARRAEQALGKLAVDGFPSDVKVEPRLLRGGPSYEITRAARELGAGLIVISTHGASALKSFFIGSTAEQVVRHADCPVLVVPPPMKE
jgi:universal stress protein A